MIALQARPGRAKRRRPAAAAAVIGLLLLSAAAPGHATDPAEPPPSRITPPQVVEAIAAACNERRYSDVSEFVHPTLRRNWMDVGVKVKDFCDRLSHDGTLTRVRIDREEQAGAYAMVFVTYIYREGAEQPDRSALLRDKGVWKLAN